MTESPSSTSDPIPLRPVDRGRAKPRAAQAGLHDTLPRPLTSLFGRDADVAAVLALLMDDGVRLLTLTGPGGVGKTRLALRAGEDATSFADGVVFVSLSTITDPDLVVPAIARGLGLREEGVQSPAELVTDYLRERRVLLVLDNFEQVRPAALQVAMLLARCPGLAVLATSRVLLRITAEQRYPVAPLAPPPLLAPVDPAEDAMLAAASASPAVQLFVARARAVDPSFALGPENAAAVAAICRQLDGLPLAIELAAARLRLFAPGELLFHLSPALPLLTDGPDDAPDRLRTMRNAISWSYDLLTERERTLFRRLAVFNGGFTLAAAEWVSGDGCRVSGTGSDAFGSETRHPTPDTLGIVASLVDSSLVRRVEVDGETRFGMLETIREFGLDQLRASGEAEDIAARHAAWCISLAEEVRRIGGLSQAHGLDALEAERPNLRAALHWLLARGETTAALHLSGFLAEFWLRHGHLAEGEGWLERALAAGDGGATARAEALVGLSMLLWMRHEFPRAERLLAEAEAVARAAGDAGALAYVRLHQGFVAALRGDVELAESRGEEALRTGEAIPQRFSLNAALWLVAIAALGRGANDRATDLYERLLASAREGGDAVSHANALYGLAVLAERRGESDRALAGFAAAAVVCGSIDDRWAAGHFLDMAATTAASLGRVEPAVRLFAAVAAMRTAVGAASLPVWIDERHGHERALAAARAALGAERFATAWGAGNALAFDAAIAEATTLAEQTLPTESDRIAGRAEMLTPRERDVLRLLVRGWSDKEIAAALGIARRTVSNHVVTIRAKLDAPSRAAAAAIAVRDHLV